MNCERPLAIDLFCGLGGWTEGLLAEGYDVIGFDIERHEYGDHHYPGMLVIQDVTTLHGSQFKDAALIVASPPCQAYSYRAMPWKRAKALPPPDNTLFETCFRIQREACEAAGRHIPLIVENVRGAQKWVGRARWNFGSFYLWGDVPALMPITLKAVKVGMGSWRHPDDPRHVPGLGFNTHADRNLREAAGIKAGDAGWRERGPGRQLQDRAIKNNGGSWFNVAHNTTSGKGQNPDGRKGVGPAWDAAKGCGAHGMKRWTNPAESLHQSDDEGRKIGGDWFSDPQSTCRRHGSKSKGRKMASAMIAKIPLPLSRHIAATYRTAFSEGE